MLKLTGPPTQAGSPGRWLTVWRVCLPEDRDSDRDGAGDQGPAKSLACLVRAGRPAGLGCGLYLRDDPRDGDACGTQTPSRATPATPGPVLDSGPNWRTFSSATSSTCPPVHAGVDRAMKYSAPA